MERPEDPAEREVVVPRVHARLSHLLWLRFHVGALVATTIVAGAAVSVVLQRVDLFRSALGLRYAIACGVAYVWFLVAVRWWVKYVAGIRPLVGDAIEDAGRFDTSRTAKEDDERRSRKNSPDGRGDGCNGCDGCSDPGCLDLEGLGVLVLVAAVVLGITWIFSAGPLILTEIAADTLLAGGLLKWARRAEVAWMESAFRATRWPFALALVIAIGFGLFAEKRCPAATRIGEVWVCLGR
jgi:hypothetical protein